MLTEKEILEKGYEEVADNLYLKDGSFFVQHMGQLVFASSLTEEEFDNISDLQAYKRLTKKNEKPESPKKKEEKRSPEKKQGNEVLVVRDENEAHDFMNIKDDEQILAEMQGKYLEEFVYSFPTKEGRTVTGLSWAGVKEVARTQGNIDVYDVKISETEAHFRILSNARDTRRNVSMPGIAEQSKKMKLKTGEEIIDQHALSKCLSRSVRNSVRALIPELMIKTMIEQYLKEKGKK
jgi:hypothetical protein